MNFMSNTKELQKINTDILDNIHAVYVTDIKEIQQYFPQHIQDTIDKLDDKTKQKIINSGRRMTSGIKSSIPMICNGDKCCLQSICALLAHQVQPQGFSCPYEEMMVDKLTAEYYNTLQIDPYNRIERDQVKQMVELIIIDNRASSEVARNGLYTEQVVGVDNKGRPIVNLVESLAYNIKLKTQHRLEKLQQELLGTRKVKKQYDLDGRRDPSSKASTLYEKFKEIAEAEVIDGPKEQDIKQ